MHENTPTGGTFYPFEETVRASERQMKFPSSLTVKINFICPQHFQPKPHLPNEVSVYMFKIMPVLISVLLICLLKYTLQNCTSAISYTDAYDETIRENYKSANTVCILYE